MEKARHAYQRLLTMLKLVTMLSLAVLPFSTAAGMTHVASHAAMQMHMVTQTDASVDNSASALSEHCPSADTNKTKPIGDSGKSDKKDCCKTFCASVAVLADAGEVRFGLPRSTLNVGLQSQLSPGERAGLHRPPRA
ncbi:hypothetical protein HT585_26670 [Ensifer sp. HO-A22]|uniref:Uncharacterized protein n=1 Tax=Ensifer oleiphilus TaxID=2742698 RepID=A0A7Y6QBD1_9HYPH|nr:hypothetical protein [Ensifer oleiphilus]NVD42461.1 hypothetical protein [Ensifer oleiphilus]